MLRDISTALFLLSLPSIAEPCACAPAGPPCAAYWNASATFRGRVDAIERAPAGSTDPLASSTVTLTLLESFKDRPSSGTIQIRTPGSTSACGYRFIVGREYVVYASRGADGVLTTTTCSRTGPVEGATADLGYARGVARGAQPLGRITGRVVLRYRDLSRRRDREQPVREVSLLLTKADAPVEARTDRAGGFSVSGLDAGVYDVDIKFAAAMRFTLKPDRIELADVRGCADVKIAVIPDGRVAGRVLNAEGRPVAGLTIELSPLAALKTASLASAEHLRTTTGQDGRYEFTSVPPGTFAAGINTREEIHGIERVLYPGVIAASEAAALAVRPGARVEAGDFVLPPAVEVAQVVGFVFDTHGGPVEGARVYLRGPDERDFIIGEPVTTDFMGRFTIAARLEGAYQLFAERDRPGDARRRVDASAPTPFVAARSATPLMLKLRRQ